jgi:hypothetical protein
MDPAKVEAIKLLKDAIMPIVESSKLIGENVKNINLTSEMAGPFNVAIGALYTINQKINSLGFSLDESKVEAITNLESFIKKVGEIGNFLSSNGDALTTISENEANLSTAIDSLKNIADKINNAPIEIDEAKATVIESLNSLIQTIINTLTLASGIQPAAATMGAMIITGFKEGTANLGATTTSIISIVVTAVQSRYETMRSAGSALGASLLSGFKSGASMGSPMEEVIASLDQTISYIRGQSDKFYNAGLMLGSGLATGLTDEQKKLLYNSSTEGIYKNTISLSSSAAGGGIIPAAGGDVGYGIEYPSANNYEIHLNGLVTEQGMIDKLMGLIQKGDAQENLRI